jgi:DnaJ-class molecular chaperone
MSYLTYYDLLKISPQANSSQIKSAYLFQISHLDDQDLIKTLKKAYYVLMNPEKRKKYDEKVKKVLEKDEKKWLALPKTQLATQPPTNINVSQPFHFDEMNDMFDQMMEYQQSMFPFPVFPTFKIPKIAFDEKNSVSFSYQQEYISKNGIGAKREKVSQNKFGEKKSKQKIEFFDKNKSYVALEPI